MSKTTNLSALSDVVKVTSGFTQLDNESGYNGLIIGANDSTGTHIVSEFSGLNIYSGTVGAGAKRLGIDSAGRVTMPYQPSFQAAGSVGNYQIAAGDQQVLSTALTTVSGYGKHNIGGCYNTSNGRFTAPVTGVYHISANARWETGAFTQNGYIRLLISINGGSAHYQNGIHAINGMNEAWSNYMAMSISGNVHLIAGDYVELRGGMNNGASQLYASESGWSMYLVG